MTFLITIIFIIIKVLTGVLDVYEKLRMPSFIDVLLLVLMVVVFGMFISAYATWKCLKAKKATDAQMNFLLLVLFLFIFVFQVLVFENTSMFTCLIPIANTYYNILSIFIGSFNKLHCILSIIFNLVLIWTLIDKIVDITESDEIILK